MPILNIDVVQFSIFMVLAIEAGFLAGLIVWNWRLKRQDDSVIDVFITMINDHVEKHHS